MITAAWIAVPWIVASTRIEFHVTPLADLYTLVRAHAAAPAPGTLPPELPGFADAVAAAKAVERTLGGMLAWQPLDRELEACATAAELRSRFAALPGIGAEAAALADAIAVLEPRFEDELWPAREAAIAAARARLDRTFVPHERECFADVLAHLGFPDPDATIPVFLTLDAPPFGGVTFERAGGGGICFVAIRGAEGSQLHEVILHESLHAIDLATPAAGEPASASPASHPTSLIDELRAKLVAAGVAPRDRRGHDLWHTIFFAEAAATIQARVDPEHRPYGEVAGYYAKVKSAAALVLPRWPLYRAGKLDRATLIEQLVAETAKG